LFLDNGKLFPASAVPHTAFDYYTNFSKLMLTGKQKAKLCLTRSIIEFPAMSGKNLHRHGLQ
jgi:hypothetical protein